MMTGVCFRPKADIRVEHSERLLSSESGHKAIQTVPLYLCVYYIGVYHINLFIAKQFTSIILTTYYKQMKIDGGNNNDY